eukprot:scaffold633_cov321-Pavlova_lutheri.AAC.2
MAHHAPPRTRSERSRDIDVRDRDLDPSLDKGCRRRGWRNGLSLSGEKWKSSKGNGSNTKSRIEGVSLKLGLPLVLGLLVAGHECA